MKVRTRFAPSPTGYLHVGGVRTSLFSWLVARQAGGQFILRIEDTDRNRHVEASEKHIVDSLNWLGLNWDEGPIRQSDRLDIYEKWAKKLIKLGRAYADIRTSEELDEIRQKAAADKKPVLFRDSRPENPPDWKPGIPLRFKSDPKPYKWHDEVMGDQATGAEAIDDFILIKSDGFPTYNFAHIIDDYEMEISHVIRTQEFLPSVPKFLNLHDALQIEQPKLATAPFVMAIDGNKKLSKRDGAKDILDYKKLGYLPEALINFLATLGWNDGTEQEIFSRDELIKKFNLERVHRSGARFDETRLEWMNGHYIREKPLEELYKLSMGFWPPDAKKYPDDYKKRVLSVIQERLKYLAELPDLTEFFFKDPTVNMGLIDNNKQLKKFSHQELRTLLDKSASKLAESDFSTDDLTTTLNGLLEELGQKPGVLFSLIRIATSWAPASPGLAETLNLLGKDRSLARIEKTLASLEK